MARAPRIEQQINPTGPANSGAFSAPQGLAQVGEQIQAKMDQRLQQRIERDARMGAVRGSSKALEEWNKDLDERVTSQQGDPSGMAERFTQDYDTYMAEALDATPNQRARDLLEQRLSTIGTRLALRAQEREASLTLAYRSEQLDESLQSHANALLSDPSQYDVALEQQEDLLEAMRGQIAEPVLEKMIDDHRNTLAVSAVTALISRNPASAKQMLLDKQFDDELQPGSKATLMARAESQITQRNNQLEREADAALRAALKFGRDQREVLRNGNVDTGLDQALEALDALDVPEAEQMAAQLRMWREFVPRVRDFSMRSPAQQLQERNLLAAEVNSGESTEDSRELLQLMDQIIGETRAELNAGRGLALAVQRGLIEEPPPLLVADENGNVIVDQEAVATRNDLADQVGAVYGRVVSPLGDDEATAFQAQFDNAPTVDSKLEVLGMLSGFEGDKLQAIAEQISEDGPAMAVAISLSTDRDRDTRKVARDIVAGMAILQSGEVKTPVADFASSLPDSLIAAFGGADQFNAFEPVVAATRAVYAARMGSAGIRASEFDADVLRQAAFDVLGGEPVSHNGTPTLLPRRGMDGFGFKRMVQRLTDEQMVEYGSAFNYQSQSFEELTELPSDSNGRHVNAADVRDDATLQAVGNGLYLVTYPQGPAAAGAGRAYVLDLGRLADEGEFRQVEAPEIPDKLGEGFGGSAL